MDSDIKSIRPRKAKKSKKKTEKKKFVKWLKKLPWNDWGNPKWLDYIKNVSTSTDDQVSMILIAIQPCDAFYDKVDTTQKKLNCLMSENFAGKSSTMITGCTANKIALKCSDVDIFIKFDDLYSLDEEELLNEIYNIIKRLPETFLEVKKIDSSMLGLQFKSGGISFNLNYSEEIEPYYSTLIADLLSIDEMIKNMIVLIRFWIKFVESTCEKFRLKSFTICFLVLFYLQEKYKVDPVCGFINFQGEGVGGWHCEVKNYLKKVSGLYLEKDVSITKLIRGFFDYYASFDFESLVICPYVGKALKKCVIANPNYLPRVYSSYIDDLRLEPSWKSCFETPLSMQDPFMHRTNLTEDLDVEAVDHFTKALKKASTVFAENSAENALYALFEKETNNNKIVTALKT